MKGYNEIDTKDLIFFDLTRKMLSDYSFASALLTEQDDVARYLDPKLLLESNDVYVFKNVMIG